MKMLVKKRECLTGYQKVEHEECFGNIFYNTIHSNMWELSISFGFYSRTSTPFQIITSELWDIIRNNKFPILHTTHRRMFLSIYKGEVW